MPSARGCEGWRSARPFRQHREHAGMRGGRRDVDCAQARVRVSAAHEGHVQQPWRLDVADIASAARDEARILSAAHWRTERAVPGLLGR
jgi:hypothetical protein